MKFDAFISYSHARDLKLASALHTSLHRLGKPWYKPRALRIFRDQTDLSVNPNLWDSILNGLGQSRFFILMACPKAAASKWVDQEVAYWAANQPTNNILLVLTEGEIVWDAEACDFDWNKTNAIPASLKGVFKGEPLWVDFRELRSQTDLSLANPAFQEKAVYLAATLHGKSPAEMVGEEMLQHRKTIRIRNAAIGVLALLTLVSIAAAGFAFWQRDLANDRLRIATSSDLSSQAALEISKDPTLAFHLADSALAMVDTNGKAEDVIFQVTHQAMQFPLYTQLAKFPGLSDGKMSLDGKRFYLALGKFLHILDACAKPLEEIAFPDSILHVAISPSGQSIAVLSRRDQVYLFDVETKEIQDLKKSPLMNKCDAISFSPLGTYVCAMVEGYGAQVYDIQQQSWMEPMVNNDRNSQMDYSSFFEFSPDDRYAAMCFADMDFDVVNLAQRKSMFSEQLQEHAESGELSGSSFPSSCAFEGHFLRVKAGDFVIQIDLDSEGAIRGKPVFSHGKGSQLPFDGDAEFAQDVSGEPGHLLTNGYRVWFDAELNVQKMIGTGLQSATRVSRTSQAGVLLAAVDSTEFQWVRTSNWGVEQSFRVGRTKLLDFGLQPSSGLFAILGDGRIVHWNTNQWEGHFLVKDEGEHSEFQHSFSINSAEAYLFKDSNKMSVFDLEGNFLRMDSLAEPEFDLEWGPLSWWRGVSGSDWKDFLALRDLKSFIANAKDVENENIGEVTQFLTYRLSLDHRHMMLYWADPYRPHTKAYLFPTQATEVARIIRQRLAKDCTLASEK